MFDIENRRYVGSKAKLMPWIKKKILYNCKNCNSFFDVFAGTGIVSTNMLEEYDTFYINDFLFSNEIIYKAFFSSNRYSKNIIKNFEEEINTINVKFIKDNYVSKNYGNKYFTKNDSKIIGHARDQIEKLYNSKKIKTEDYYVLLASLIYSLDRIANTVGHYEAYRKNGEYKDSFFFNSIYPLNTKNKKIIITREDANIISKKVKADIAFIDPPYNSRQYSRFYHVLENIVTWKKPKLHGTAMKPKEENMSEYCRTNAPIVFDELVNDLQVKYIVVTYNNTYNSKSSSSKNKISLEEIKQSLQKRGKTKIYETPYRFFNAGKTNLEEHKEILFITEVKND